MAKGGGHGNEKAYEILKRRKGGPAASDNPHPGAQASKAAHAAAVAALTANPGLDTPDAALETGRNALLLRLHGTIGDPLLHSVANIIRATDNARALMEARRVRAETASAGAAGGAEFVFRVEQTAPKPEGG